jgi:hypothetical protein
MACHCIEEVNAKLAERNTRIMIPIMLGRDQTRRVMIVTEQIETGRGKPKAVGFLPAYCPFCGNSYENIPAVSFSEVRAACDTALRNLLPPIWDEIEQRKHGGNDEDWAALEQLAIAAQRALEGAPS